MRAFGRRFRQAAVDWFGLPADTLLDVSRLTCLNAQELALYNVVSLEQVSETTLRADLGAHTVQVDGHGFTVTLVTDREIHLMGDIANIAYTPAGGTVR